MAFSLLPFFLSLVAVVPAQAIASCNFKATHILPHDSTEPVHSSALYFKDVPNHGTMDIYPEPAWPIPSNFSIKFPGNGPSLIYNYDLATNSCRIQDTHGGNGGGSAALITEQEDATLYECWVLNFDCW